jgi:hypothetical protein
VQWAASGYNANTKADQISSQSHAGYKDQTRSVVLTACGCHAAGNEVSRQARQQQQHYLPQLGWTAAAAFSATPAAWFYSKLSWWGLESSLLLHVAHMHCGSHYSVKSLYQPGRRHR